MSRPLSIAFLSHMASSTAPTGAEQSLALLAGGLRERGHRVGVVAPQRWVLEEQLRRERRSARTLTLGVRFSDGQEVTRTRTRVDAISTRAELHEGALELLARSRAGEREVRGLRLRAAKLTRLESDSEPRQLRLF